MPGGALSDKGDCIPGLGAQDGYGIPTVMSNKNKRWHAAFARLFGRVHPAFVPGGRL